MHVVDGIRLIPPYAGPHCLCYTVQRDRKASSTDSMPVCVCRYAILQPEDYQAGLYKSLAFLCCLLACRKTCWGGKQMSLWFAKHIECGSWRPCAIPSSISRPVLQASKTVWNRVWSMLDTVQHFITSDKDVGVGLIPFKAVLFTINHICVLTLGYNFASKVMWFGPHTIKIHSFQNSNTIAIVLHLLITQVIFHWNQIIFDYIWWCKQWYTCKHYVWVWNRSHASLFPS